MTKTRPSPFWLTILNRLASADQRYRQSRKLRSLPDERLSDLGISRAEAEAEFLSNRFSRLADKAPIPLSHHAG